MEQSRTSSTLAAALILVAVALGPLPAATQKNARDWKAGRATVVITPAEPIWMSGYAGRKKPSEGTAQELFAKALALEDRRGQRVVIITTDLLGVVRAVVEPVAERVRERHGLRREQLLFTSSHTHSGPVIRESLVGSYALDDQQKTAVRSYTDGLQEKLVELVGAALKDLAPARLSFGRGHATFAMNRRAKREKGYVIDVNPQGPVEHEVPVLRVERWDGALRAVLFSYACHNTTLGADNYRFHGDYAGEAQEAIEKAQPGTVALFMAGTGADANPHPRGTIELARTHGRSLADAVIKTLGGTLQPVKGPLRAAFDRVDLPFGKPLTREQWQARLEEKDVFRQRHARAMLAMMDAQGKVPAHYPYPIQVIRLDKGLTLVALAGEVVVDYALRLKRELGADRLWVVAYANDVFAYIASRRVLSEGGYEAETSMVYYGQPGPWDPAVEDTVVGKVHELVKKVK